MLLNYIGTSQTSTRKNNRMWLPVTLDLASSESYFKAKKISIVFNSILWQAQIKNITIEKTILNGVSYFDFNEHRDKSVYI